MYKHKQLTIFVLDEDFQSSTNKNKLKMLSDYIDIEEIIPLAAYHIPSHQCYPH